MMVAFVAVQHGLLVRDLRGWEEVAVTAAMVGFGTRNLALGFGCGIALQQVTQLSRRLRANWAVST